MTVRRPRRIGTALVVPKVEVWKDTTAGELQAGDVYREGNAIGGDPTCAYVVIKVERTFMNPPVLLARTGIAGRAKGKTSHQSYAEWCVVDVLDLDNVIGK